jgi:hypothetical protein
VIFIHDPQFAVPQDDHRFIHSSMQPLRMRVAVLVTTFVPKCRSKRLVMFLRKLEMKHSEGAR